jgi:hypothetical protein
MSILIVFLFGIIAVAGIKLLGRTRGQHQFAKIEALVAAEREELARRQEAHPFEWSPESAETFLGILRDQLKTLGATQVVEDSDGTNERTIYEADQFVLTLVHSGGTWEVWLGSDGRHDSPASFWLAALRGSHDVPVREADYVELADFARQLPQIVTDWSRLQPLVTLISANAARRFRADLKSSS